MANVPRISIKDMLNQPEVDGRWGKQITEIKEYDMVI